MIGFDRRSCFDQNFHTSFHVVSELLVFVFNPGDFAPELLVFAFDLDDFAFEMPVFVSELFESVVALLPVYRDSSGSGR